MDFSGNFSEEINTTANAYLQNHNTASNKKTFFLKRKIEYIMLCLKTFFTKDNSFKFWVSYFILHF